MIATLTLNPALDIATTTPKVGPTHKLRCTAPLYDAGGGGINVARVLVELGEPTCALFPVGGPAGEMICRLLDTAGVPAAAVPTAGLTRQSFAVTDETSGEQYRFVLPGPELDEAAQAALLDRIATLDPAPRYLVVSGSVPAGIDAGFFERLHALCERIGCRAVLDSSGEGLRAAKSLCAWLIKPSLSELEAQTGTPLPDRDAQAAAARAMRTDYAAQAVLLSLGSEGALLVTASAETYIPPIAVPVVSGIGAGDTMVAATTVALSRGWSPEKAARYGVAAGAAALMTPATQLARREDIDRLFAQHGAGLPLGDTA